MGRSRRLGAIRRVHDDGGAAVRSVDERGEHAEAASLPGRQCRRSHEGNLRRKDREQNRRRQEAQHHQWGTTTRYPLSIRS